jgi:hypothetical protein
MRAALWKETVARAADNAVGASRPGEAELADGGRRKASRRPSSPVKRLEQTTYANPAMPIARTAIVSVAPRGL